MFINDDIMDFFSSMMELEKQQRDFLKKLSDDVDDPVIKDKLFRISMDEQRHMDYVRRIMDLVSETCPPDPGIRAYS